MDASEDPGHGLPFGVSLVCSSRVQAASQAFQSSDVINVRLRSLKDPEGGRPVSVRPRTDGRWLAALPALLVCPEQSLGDMITWHYFGLLIFYPFQGLFSFIVYL